MEDRRFCCALKTGGLLAGLQRLQERLPIQRRRVSGGEPRARAVGGLTEEAQLAGGAAAHGEESPERLRGVDAQQAAARAPVDAQPSTVASTGNKSSLVSRAQGPVGR